MGLRDLSLKKDRCPNCLGEKVRKPKCTHCGGKGTVQNPKGALYLRKKCPPCKGKGRVKLKCYRCDGTGKI
jgi:DnaJ-class molecular chaperone